MAFNPTDTERARAILESGRNFGARVRAETSELASMFPVQCDMAAYVRLAEIETLDPETLNELLLLYLADHKSMKFIGDNWRTLGVCPQAAGLYLAHLRNLSSGFLLRLSEKMDAAGL